MSSGTGIVIGVETAEWEVAICTWSKAVCWLSMSGCSEIACEINAVCGESSFGIEHPWAWGNKASSVRGESGVLLSWMSPWKASAVQ